MPMRLFQPDEWEAVRRRAQAPEFAAALARLRAAAADYLAQPMDPPDAPAGYYHDYFCPQHGVELEFNIGDPTRHRCPVDGQEFGGERLDAARRWFVNHRLSEASLRLALAWRLDGDPRALTALAAILGGYAGRYADYASFPPRGPNPGVATYTTLDEAVWLLPLAWAFDLVRDDLGASLAADVAGRLLQPAAEHLVRRHIGIVHNFACWHNAAIGTVGRLLGHDDLVDIAVRGPLGFETQTQEGVLADGLWWEGSMSYHFYALYPLLSLAKALPELRRHPVLAAMLRAPLLCAYPDLSLPAPNDCWYFTHLLADVCHGVPPGPAFYELGYAWTGAADFAAVLQRAYEGAERDSLDALLFGVDALPFIAHRSSLIAHRSALLPASGLAVVRTPNLHLLLKYGPHGGGHGHPDKLAVSAYAHGQRLSPDLGTPGYGLDLFTSWYRQTLSHNTVVIEGQSQPEAAGELVAFQPDSSVQVAAAQVAWDTEGPYGDVRLRRALLLRPSYWLDLTVVECPAPRQVDWVYRNVGRLDLDAAPDPTPSPSPTKGGEPRRGEVPSPDPSPHPSPGKGGGQDRGKVPSPLPPPSLIGKGGGGLGLHPTGDGYQHIADPVAYAPTTPYTATWQAEGVSLRLWANHEPGETVVTGSVPGYPPTERQALLLRRRHAQATAFVALCHPYTAAPDVQAVAWGGDLAEGGLVCHVQTRVGLERWTLRFDADLEYTFEESSDADTSSDAARPA
ncbi:MAG: heparinase II/III family protein [Anaerolineae bacterium]|nr:heparinase II/III family protein [Anaerolineae bacterium]